MTGTPAFDGDVTQLNEQNDPLVFVITENIVIRTGAGNDGVELNNINVPKNLTIQTGDGLDRVNLGYCTMNAAVTIAWPPVGENVPGGRDRSHSSRSEFQLDYYSYRPLNWTEGTVGIGRDLSISTGDAADYVFLGHIDVTRDIAVRTGDGADNFIVHTVSARNVDVGTERDADLANVTALIIRAGR